MGMAKLTEKLKKFLNPFFSSKQKSEKSIIEINEHFHLIAENAQDLISIVDREKGRYVYTSPSYLKILGYRPKQLIGTRPLDLVHPEDRDNLAHSGKTVSFRVRKADKSWLWIEGKSYEVTWQGRKHLVSIGRDITERLEQEEALKRSQKHFSLLADSIPQIVWTADSEGKMDYYNRRWYEYTGLSEGVDDEKGWHEIIHQDDFEESKTRWEEALRSGKSFELEYRLKRASDEFYRWHLGRAVAIKDNKGKIIKWIGTSTDIHDQKEAQKTIRHQATHDSLTGLKNRKSIHEDITELLNTSKAKKEKFAIMFLDLDRFKNVNDRLGHLFGDKMLKEIAERLKLSAGMENTVGRLGGDEFIVIAPKIKTASEAVRIAEKISLDLEEVFRVDNNALHISSSIGISIFPDDGTDSHTLLRNADLALYRAKELGRNRYELFNRKLNLKAKQKLLLEGELRDALKNNEFLIHYQPIVDSQTRRIIGAESLVRWKHPTLGLMYPHEFLALAEETGIINALGDWVLKTACEQNFIWQKNGFHEHIVSINLSSQQFSHPRFLLSISQSLMKSGLDPKFLEIEVTESLAMEKIEETKDKLQELKKLGVGVTIDDFGTGYSSLSYLKRFPVNKLKIDKSFVRHSLKNSQDATIIRAIISLAHTLNLKVVGEGVESEEQFDFLRDEGCEFIQGYYLSEPLTAEEYTNLLLAQVKEVA